VSRTDQIIYLKQIMENMMKEKMLRNHPFKQINLDQALPEGGCGGILARAGVGKTAMLVQLALYSMLQGKDVLHVSLHDPVQKVSLWYRERFLALTAIDHGNVLKDLWEEIQGHRFIMTFQVGRFSIPVFKERLTDLTAQGIFHPKLILIDGYRFEEGAREALLALKCLSKAQGASLWFTVHIHRDVPVNHQGIPENLREILDLFDKILMLEMAGPDLHVRMLGYAAKHGIVRSMTLDPSTLLLTENGNDLPTDRRTKCDRDSQCMGDSLD
jgi:hypothetical protein